MELTKNIPVDYNDAAHKYSMGDKRYTSASQLVEKFTNPFETDKIAQQYAEKHGFTAEYWKKQWRAKNEKSKVRGNIIHDANETVLHGNMLDRFNGIEIPVLASVGEDVPWLERPDGIYTEAKLWHHGYHIAGRADKIILLSERGLIPLGSTTPKRHAHIEDYKTNERLNFKSYQFKNGNYKMLKPPVSYLQDCNWIHYCLQLSIYMFMLEYQGFIPGTMHIIHYPHPTEEQPNPTKQRYEVPYMKKEVVLMCNFVNR